MDPSRSHRLMHVINNCEGPLTGQYNANSNILLLCFNLSFIKFMINTREKQELPGVEVVTLHYLVRTLGTVHATHSWCTNQHYYIV